MDAHSFVARNFAHLYVVGGRQHSVGAVAKVQRIIVIVSESVRQEVKI